MGLLDGKKALIFGVANDKSIAWSVAEKMASEGAELAFAYAGERLESRVKALAESVNSKIIIPCDVTSDAEIDKCFEEVKKHWDGIDILVHSIAYAEKESLKGKFYNVSRENFRIALDVSAYSLVALIQRAYPMMKGREGANILTMTYHGSTKVIDNYNTMGVAKSALEASVRYLAEDLGPDGIRINAISAGPIKTLAAMGITGFRALLEKVAAKAPLRRSTSQEEVAGAALYLASDLAKGVTGEIHYVDSGLNVMGT